VRTLLTRLTLGLVGVVVVVLAVHLILIALSLIRANKNLAQLVGGLSQYDGIRYGVDQAANSGRPGRQRDIGHAGEIEAEQERCVVQAALLLPAAEQGDRRRVVAQPTLRRAELPDGGLA